MEILSTHTDVWKCEIVKIPLTPRPFSLFQLKIAFFLHISPKSTLTICIFDFLFVPLHKIWHVPFGSQKGTGHEGEERGRSWEEDYLACSLCVTKREHAIRKLEGGRRKGQKMEKRRTKYCCEMFTSTFFSRKGTISGNPHFHISTHPCGFMDFFSNSPSFTRRFSLFLLNFSLFLQNLSSPFAFLIFFL